MTDNTPPATEPVSWKRLGSAFGHHLAERVRAFNAVDKVVLTLLVGMALWSSWISFTTGSSWAALVMGSVIVTLYWALLATMSAAIRSLVDAHPWFGVGRTVYHQMIGPCKALEFSGWPDDEGRLDNVWVHVHPLSVDVPPRWVPLSELAETDTTKALAA